MMRGTRGALLDSVSRGETGTGGLIPVAPMDRAPLPPFPICNSCPGPYEYDKELPWDPPHTRDYMRCNAWAVTVPGLPFVPGASSEFPERAISYIAYLYTPYWQKEIWKATAARQYTHTVLCYSNFAADKSDSLQAFVDFCGGATRYVPYVNVFFGSKDYNKKDMSAQEFIDTFAPALDAVLKASVVDEVTSGFEWNLWNVPGKTTLDIFKWMGRTAAPYGVSNWCHFSEEVTSWQEDGTGRYEFWDDLGEDMRGLLYQYIQHSDIGDMQARATDSLNMFNAQGNRHIFRGFEVIPMLQFSGEPKGNSWPSEDDGDVLGYLNQCTKPVGGAYIWGYGDGGRRPDGSPL